MQFRANDVVTLPCGCVAKIIALTKSTNRVRLKLLRQGDDCDYRWSTSEWAYEDELTLSPLTIAYEELSDAPTSG